MRCRLLLVFGVCMLVLGCGKKSSPVSDAGAPPAAGTTQPANPNNPNSRPPVPPAVPIAAPPGPDMSAALSQMSAVLRRYVFEHRRTPATFEEFASSGYIRQVPEPPPGKKFAVDAKQMQIVLVDR
jgi:hypothetical protein